MHALLGLAASELMQHDSSLVAPAIAHRVKAIKAIKKTLASTPKASTFEEGNALLATCYALTFQSVALDDGMAEYMTFVRGVLVVAIQMYVEDARFLFHDFLGDDQLELVRPSMERLPLIDRAWSEAARSAVLALEPLCTREVERGYYDMLLQIADALLVSSYDGACDESCLPPPHSISLSSPSADILSPPAYKAIAQHYSWWMQLPHEKFQQVVDPNSQVFVLLAAHWISIKQIMVTITRVERTFQTEGQPQQQPQPGASPGADRDVDLGIVRWLKYLNRELDPEYLPFNQWPLWVEAELDRDPAAFGGR